MSKKENRFEEKQILVTRSSLPPYEEYCDLIKSLWDSHWLTNMGVLHKQLEKELALYLDVPMVSLLVNGHMALELLIQAYGFPKGSEIITTPFSFISTTHAIVRNGLRPVFCDVKETDGTIDEKKIEELITTDTVAILPVHVYGNICNVEQIRAIADKYNLKVIYDAAHAFGEKTDDIGIGNYGDASIFSFHATKVFNTIEGGAVVCKDKKLYDKLYNLKNFGIRGEEIVEEVGSNAKMNEFSAAMGICNLRHIENAIEDRKRCAKRYFNNLINEKRMSFLISQDEYHNYGYMPIVISDDSSLSRDEIYCLMREKGIRCRKYFYPIIPMQKCYKSIYGSDNLQHALYLSEHVLTLPIYEGLSEENIDRICSILCENI